MTPILEQRQHQAVLAAMAGLSLSVLMNKKMFLFIQDIWNYLEVYYVVYQTTGVKF